MQFTFRLLVYNQNFGVSTMHNAAFRHNYRLLRLTQLIHSCSLLLGFLAMISFFIPGQITVEHEVVFTRPEWIPSPFVLLNISIGSLVITTAAYVYFHHKVGSKRIKAINRKNMYWLRKHWRQAMLGLATSIALLLWYLFAFLERLAS